MLTDFKDRLTVSGAPSAWGLHRTSVKLLKALRLAEFIPGKSIVVWSITVVSRAEMMRLNRKYRGKRQPTDVLSFEQPGKPPRGVLFLGDLVLCLPIVRSQARRHGHGVRAESTVLLAHGVLHLLGYDHERSPREDRLMLAAEQKLLRAIGFGSAGLIRRGKL